jgi:MFS family permease
MTTLVTTKGHTANQPQVGTHAGVRSGWRSTYRIGAIAAVAVLALVPIQAAVFIMWPPPATVGGFFSMFQQNAIVGLLALDLLLMASWILSALMFVALYAALRRTRESLVTIALIAELVGLAVYFGSNTSFSMLTLSQQYATATTDADRSLFLAAGQAMLALYTGTAFNERFARPTQRRVQRDEHQRGEDP